MAGSEKAEGLRCTCGKTLLWMTPKGIEVQCRGCKRRIEVPFDQLRGPGSAARFLDEWRKREKARRV
jgi:hypothetical protein